MIREIGSEFPFSHNDSELNKRNSFKLENGTLCFSGRTAIDIAINDAKIKKAILPSYCCSSMIEPFKRNGVEICFYCVNYKKKVEINLNIPKDCDAILWCDYFGYKIEYPKALYDFKNKGGIVIEDITHSLFSKSRFEEADYYVASIRKWGGLISGGLVIKNGGKISATLFNPNKDFLSIKREAMELKSQYLNDLDFSKKEKFLKLFEKSNQYFSLDYENVAMDDFSISQFEKWDIQAIINKRINNAKILHQGLENNAFIKPMFPQNDMECPLIVPVIVRDAQARDHIRKKLIEKEIYCPIHWPKGNDNNTSDIYDRELSLVCDQRYTKEDMKRILNVISEVTNELY